MFIASSDHNPEASARPASDRPSGPGKASGNSVRTVARQVMAGDPRRGRTTTRLPLPLREGVGGRGRRPDRTAASRRGTPPPILDPLRGSSPLGEGESLFPAPLPQLPL